MCVRPKETRGSDANGGEWEVKTKEEWYWEKCHRSVEYKFSSQFTETRLLQRYSTLPEVQGGSLQHACYNYKAQSGLFLCPSRWTEARTFAPEHSPSVISVPSWHITNLDLFKSDQALLVCCWEKMNFWVNLANYLFLFIDKSLLLSLSI